MSSHNSAISSRTDLNPVVSSQSLYIATLVGRLCCTRLLIHYNASLLDPCIIVSNRPEDYLFLRASSFLYGASSDSLIPLSGAFHCSLRRCYVCLWEICLPGGRIRLPFDYYITQIKMLVNLFGFKYGYALDIPRK